MSAINVIFLFHKHILGEISGSHGVKYEDGCHLSGMLCYVIWYTLTSVSETLTASTMRAMIDGDRSKSEILVSVCHYLAQHPRTHQSSRYFSVTLQEYIIYKVFMSL